ncbi:MAG: hypothetical protein RMK20_03600 [Verrucomicrobiales bacterium]|nr:hypothetical protein [Verrucomicrobiales bacterium]
MRRARFQPGRATALALTLILSTFAWQLHGNGLVVTRAFDRLVTLTNRPIVVTVTLSNATGQTLRGLWFGEQVPSGLEITSLSVSINGRSVTNHQHEIGQEGDVYPGCVPRRWVLERPRAFAENNPLPAGATVQILYALTAASPGAFSFPQCGVAGYIPQTTNTAFGLGADAPVAHFLTLTNRYAVFGESTPEGFRLTTDAPAGWRYAVESSTNLQDWSRLATNVAPAPMLDTNVHLPLKFYRLLWLP